MILAAFVVSCFTAVFALRLVIGYSRTVAAMKRLKEEEFAKLPNEIREALCSRWIGSWQSPVFHEIALGDISWAENLALGPTLIATRWSFRWMMVGISGALVVLLIQLALSR